MKLVLQYSLLILIGLVLFDAVLIFLHLNYQIVYDLVMYAWPTGVLIFFNKNLQSRTKVNFSKIIMLNLVIGVLVSIFIALILGSMAVISFSGNDFFRANDFGYGVSIGATAFVSSLIWLVIDALVASTFSKYLKSFIKRH